MKNRSLRVLALALLLALTAGVVPAMAAQPGSASIAIEKLYADTGEYYIKIDGWTYSEEIISITSSDPTVINVTDNSRYVKIKKAGSSTITIVYDLEGVTYEISGVLTVEKYPKPISSLTVNGKKISLKKERRVMYTFERQNLERDVTVKINLKPASGWKISKIKAYYYKVGHQDTHHNLAVKNNKKFTVKKRCEAYVTYVLKNKKNGTKFNYVVRVWTPGE